MAQPILYSYRRCPYAMRARMALHYANIAVDIREIVLKAKPTHMLQVSPKGTVPVLVLPDGVVIDESLDIMRWALQHHDPEGWLGSPALLAQAESLIAENDGPFKHALDRYKYAIRFPEQPPEVYRAQGEIFLQQLESRLQQQSYLLGSHQGLADVAIFPFVRQFAMVDQPWFLSAPYPQVRAWLQAWVESERFAAIMQKYPIYTD
ncbi:MULTISPECIES: glutathione S-transferase [Methylobacillus]|uniref:Glutathione S-transferase-like protein n=1 Tax=Methylobacillus flagellatus (strain ATCC 51484 / DSM 6875 / VKM B-1610 / KT) TaxID=265072 RepID=Q1H410_METFK|nr:MULTISPECIES: glutathione S-transferase [Methylobacillus]ABE48777.1 glutathione S-transferase-like protein [Methylobacillus flagellatus KT]MPS49427.1 glutathione S-transferase [Methylobacillus sp.]